MTNDDTVVCPPGWAESLLRLLLPRRDRDSVSGDLLEEYRETIVPSLGASADRWYVRQVAAYALRQTWMWTAAVVVIDKVRFLFDIFVPIHYTPGVIATRSAIMSQALIATFAMCGAWHAWRTEHLRAGVLLAVLTAWIAGAFALMGAAAFLVFRHDSATMAAIQNSGGMDELWAIPLLLMPVAAFITGAAGAMAGRVAALIYGASRPNTKSA